MGKTKSQIKGWQAALVVVVLALAGMVLIRFGTVHPEVHTYLPHYLGPDPFWQTVFDVNINDSGCYQARELSYFFDYVDCHYIDLCMGWHLPHFLSFTYYLFCGLISVIVWRFAVHDLLLDRGITLLILALFWTAPQIVMSGFEFRSAKIGTAMMICAFFWVAHRALLPSASRSPGSRRRGSMVGLWFTIFALSFGAALFDRQGFFMAVVGTAALGLYFCLYRGPEAFWMASASATAVGVDEFYNRWLCPRIIHHLCGYYPSFDFQKEDILSLWSRNTPVGDSLLLILDTARFFLGNLSQVQMGLVLVATFGLIYFLAKRAPSYPVRRPILGPWAAMGLFYLVLFAVFIMNTLMIMRHGALLWPDIRRLYYWVPAVSLFLMTFVLLLGWVNRAGWMNVRLARLILGVMVVCNLCALPEHYSYWEKGHIAPWVMGSRRLICALFYLGETGHGSERDFFYQLFWTRHIQRPLPCPFDEVHLEYLKRLHYHIPADGSWGVLQPVNRSDDAKK